MQLRIDAANGIPIYEQIVRQIKFAVASEALTVGEHIPSVRDMAAQAAVNPNTVARAYRDLQAEGIVLSIRGTGLAVTTDAPRLCRQARLEIIRQQLRSVLSQAVQSQIDSTEILRVLQEELRKQGLRESS